jgi:hypothetical protein
MILGVVGSVATGFREALSQQWTFELDGIRQPPNFTL